jgi:hypothetical protein
VKINPNIKIRSKFKPLISKYPYDNGSIYNIPFLDIVLMSLFKIVTSRIDCSARYVPGKIGEKKYIQLGVIKVKLDKGGIMVKMSGRRLCSNILEVAPLFWS